MITIEIENKEDGLYVVFQIKRSEGGGLGNVVAKIEQKLNVELEQSMSDELASNLREFADSIEITINDYFCENE